MPPLSRTATPGPRHRPKDADPSPRHDTLKPKPTPTTDRTPATHTYIPRAPPLRLPASISSLPGPGRPSASPSSRNPVAAAGKLRSQGTRSEQWASSSGSEARHGTWLLLSTGLGIRSPARPGARCKTGGGGVDEGLWGCGLVVPWPRRADWAGVAKPRGVVRWRGEGGPFGLLLAGRSRRVLPSSCPETNPPRQRTTKRWQGGDLMLKGMDSVGQFGLLLGSTTAPNPRQMLVMCERESRREEQRRQGAKPPITAAPPVTAAAPGVREAQPPTKVDPPLAAGVSKRGFVAPWSIGVLEDHQSTRPHINRLTRSMFDRLAACVDRRFGAALDRLGRWGFALVG